jgi:hypothetical protein
MSLRCDEHPDATRREAREYANKVLLDGNRVRGCNRIINITESLNKWGTVQVVWYEAEREVSK